jgi:hypothetical protein
MFACAARDFLPERRLAFPLFAIGWTLDSERFDAWFLAEHFRIHHLGLYSIQKLANPATIIYWNRRGTERK